MHSDERQDFAGLGAGVLDDEVPAVGLVGGVVDDERAAAGGGAVGAEDVEYVGDNPVLLRDEVRRVVLHELGLADELGQKGNEGVLVKISESLLYACGSHFCDCCCAFSKNR